MKYLNKVFSVPMYSHSEVCEKCNKSSNYYIKLNGIKQCYDCFNETKLTGKQMIINLINNILYNLFID